MGPNTLYRISAVLLFLAMLGHTFGGMIGVARKGPDAGEQADRVLQQMRMVHFAWRGTDATWYNFWLGNGLSVSALLLLPIVTLWILGGLGAGVRRATLPIAWAMLVSLTLISVSGFRYFGVQIGVVFGLIALLTGIAVVMSTLNFTS